MCDSTCKVNKIIIQSNIDAELIMKLHKYPK
jgi:hypothetical protein